MMCAQSQISKQIDWNNDKSRSSRGLSIDGSAPRARDHGGSAWDATGLNRAQPSPEKVPVAGGRNPSVDAVYISVSHS